MALTVVVPCYKEEKRLALAEYIAWFERYPDWGWLFVDDGSPDATGSVLSELARGRERVQTLSLETNVGKAEAVRRGVEVALSWRPDCCVAYLDADLATSPAELERMLEVIREPGIQAVIGCRLRRLGARIYRPTFRHYFGRFAATVISLLLKLPSYDTQCGAKVFRTETAREIFREPFSCRWLFDVELLARIRNREGRCQAGRVIVELPLNAWQDRPGSKLRIGDFLVLPWEVLKLHRRYNSPG